MQPPVEDEGSGEAPVDLLEAPACQGKPGVGQVEDRRREIELAGEPGLDRVLVGRDDVHQVSGLEGSDMIGNRLVHEGVRAGVRASPGVTDEERKSGGQPAEIPKVPRDRRAPPGGGSRGPGPGPGEGQKLFAQLCRGSEAGKRLAQSGAPGHDRLCKKGALRAHAQVLLKLDLANQVELAVAMGLEQRADFFAVHEESPLVWLSSSVCNFARARARRDMTVPMGIPATSAISR